ncbi:MAG TPA: hypothetical protein VMW08_13590 [Acidimicrobiales bacterium]|nr:hypothetical protein [Acidimicrobiales bacterium]
MPTLIERDLAEIPSLEADGPIEVDAESFASATGWELKPEGLCRGAACVPVKGTDIVNEGSIDVGAFAERLGQSVVVDADRGIVAIGGDPMSRGHGASLADVRLPSVHGGEVDLADFVGKKTLLIAWASW